MVDVTHDDIRVEAPARICFAVATDFESYPEWAKDVERVEVLVRDAVGRATQVEYRVGAFGRTVRYVLAYDYADAPTGFSWKLVESDRVRVLEGSYRFDADGPATTVAYDLSLDLSAPLPGVIKRRASQRIVQAALRDFKRQAELTSAEVPVAASVEVSMEAPAAVTPPLEGVPDGSLESESGPEPHHGPEPEQELPTHRDAVDFDDVATEARPAPQPSVLEVVLTEVLAAVPEVRDHLLAAADELLEAARAVLDAADRTVRCGRRDDEST